VSGAGHTTNFAVVPVTGVQAGFGVGLVAAPPCPPAPPVPELAPPSDTVEIVGSSFTLQAVAPVLVDARRRRAAMASRRAELGDVRAACTLISCRAMWLRKRPKDC
jgi:hypothetical protein